MQIKTIEPIAVSLPMLKPVIMAGEEVRRADNVLVRIETDSGIIGWGEAASAPVMTGETLESIVSAIHYLSSVLRGRNPEDIAGALNAIGTSAAPISITCSNASNRWGEINFPSGAGASTLQYCLVSRACHSPGGGHTGTGPMVRLAGMRRATRKVRDAPRPRVRSRRRSPGSMDGTGRIPPARRSRSR